MELYNFYHIINYSVCNLSLVFRRGMNENQKCIRVFLKLMKITQFKGSKLTKQLIFSKIFLARDIGILCTHTHTRTLNVCLKSLA